MSRMNQAAQRQGRSCRNGLSPDRLLSASESMEHETLGAMMDRSIPVLAHSNCKWAQTRRMDERVDSSDGGADNSMGQTAASATAESVSQSSATQLNPLVYRRYSASAQYASQSTAEDSTDERECEKEEIHQKEKKRNKKHTRGSRCVKRERHFVEHHYHDHSFDPVEDYVPEGLCLGSDSSTPQLSYCKSQKSQQEEMTSSMAQRLGKPRKRGGVAVPFPMKLHDLLENADKNGLINIVSWSPHGRCFAVHKSREFVASVMPRWFRQTKLTSFQRQLNLYGFCRLTRGRDAGAYYHELFLRGKPYLCRAMLRTKVKGTGYKASSSPNSEPDFYSMPPVYPVPVGYVWPHSSEESCADECGKKAPASVCVPDSPRSSCTKSTLPESPESTEAPGPCPITPNPSFGAPITPERSPSLVQIKPKMKKTPVTRRAQSDGNAVASVVSPETRPHNSCAMSTIAPAGTVIRVGNQSFQYLEHFDAVPPLTIVPTSPRASCIKSVNPLPTSSSSTKISATVSCQHKKKNEEQTAGNQEPPKKEGTRIQGGMQEGPCAAQEAEFQTQQEKEKLPFPIDEPLDDFLVTIESNLEDDVNLGYALDECVDENMCEYAEV